VGLQSDMVRSSKAHKETMFSGLAPKADLRSAPSRSCARALALLLFPAGLSGSTGNIGFVLWRKPRGADPSVRDQQVVLCWYLSGYVSGS
jgi:hypothetical protein